MGGRGSERPRGLLCAGLVTCICGYMRLPEITLQVMTSDHSKKRGFPFPPGRVNFVTTAAKVRERALDWLIV